MRHKQNNQTLSPASELSWRINTRRAWKQKLLSRYEALAAHAISEDGIFKSHQLSLPFIPPEVHGALWMLIYLMDPKNHKDLAELNRQAKMNMKGEL